MPVFDELLRKGSLPENSRYYTSMAGEFFVLAQLFLRGYLASLTYGNAKSIDILVTTKNGKMFKLEVKTTREEVEVGSDKSQFGKNYEWRMSKKHEEKKDPNLYYCFVILKKFNLPRFFIVSSKEVAEYVKREHQYAMNLPRKNGKKVKDDDTRIFRIGVNEKSHGLKPIKKYENKWDTLLD